MDEDGFLAVEEEIDLGSHGQRVPDGTAQTRRRQTGDMLPPAARAVAMVRIAGTFIDKLRLLPHPEGGYYRETYRAREVLPAAALPPRYDGARAACTAIYFLLAGDQRSTLHRLRSDEIWHFYAGSALLLSVIRPDGRLERITLGPDFDQGETFQAVVPAGAWFGAEVSVAESYSLVGCTVAPGFDFLDFETADRAALLKLYPAHGAVIERLTQRASS